MDGFPIAMEAIELSYDFFAVMDGPIKNFKTRLARFVFTFCSQSVLIGDEFWIA